jgi:hypothetical protein
LPEEVNSATKKIVSSRKQKSVAPVEKADRLDEKKRPPTPEKNSRTYTIRQPLPWTSANRFSAAIVAIFSRAEDLALGTADVLEVSRTMVDVRK